MADKRAWQKVAEAEAEEEAWRQKEIAKWKADKAAEAAAPPDPPRYPRGAPVITLPDGKPCNMYARLKMESDPNPFWKETCSLCEFQGLFENPETRPMPIPINDYLQDGKAFDPTDFSKCRLDVKMLAWIERNHLITCRRFEYPIPICICVGSNPAGGFDFVACEITSRGTIQTPTASQSAIA